MAQKSLILGVFCFVKGGRKAPPLTNPPKSGIMGCFEHMREQNSQFKPISPEGTVFAVLFVFCGKK